MFLLATYNKYQINHTKDQRHSGHSTDFIQAAKYFN
jgi:hypothetical protein